MKENKADIFGVIVIGLVLGAGITFIICLIAQPSQSLSQETLNEVCINITNNSIAEGEIINTNWRSRGDLKCVIPDFTKNGRIVIQVDGEK